jgi:hypothetical protein
MSGPVLLLTHASGSPRDNDWLTLHLQLLFEPVTTACGHSFCRWVL